MGKTEKHGAIRALEEIIDCFAGETIRKEVMEGSDEMTEQMDGSKEIADWVKGAMDRLDELVDEEIKIRIMENCGYKCSEMNSEAVEEAKARRKKYKSLDEFLEAEQRNPMKGTKLVRKGDILYQFYTPKSLGMRCYCSLVNASDEKMSLTYCHCSKGFVKKLWEAIIERPVKVELIQSVVSGADECKFAVHLKS
jgi:predicted hydrocarbon binding protein